MAEVIDRKLTLLTRAMDRLLEEPHLLAGWLSLNRKHYRLENGKVVWIRNPLGVLNDTYEYLDMDVEPADARRRGDLAARPRAAPDGDPLLPARSARRFGLRKEEFYKLNEILKSEAPQGGYDAETWAQIRAAHLGFEAGNELLGAALHGRARRWGSSTSAWSRTSTSRSPRHLHDPELQARMKKVLVPPPSTKADEIVAPFGGMFYRQEAPGRPPFVAEGAHFEKGQPLYIIEVMKMFNTVRAPFSGTIDKVVMTGRGRHDRAEGPAAVQDHARREVRPGRSEGRWTGSGAPARASC